MKWIDIKKQQPIEPYVYLVSIKIVDAYGASYRSITTAIFNGNYFYDQATGNGIKNVTHWVEVPEPPTEEDAEEESVIPPNGSESVDIIKGVDVRDFFSKMKDL